MSDHAIEEKLEREDKLPLFHKGYVDVTFTALKDIPAAMAFQPLNEAHQQSAPPWKWQRATNYLLLEYRAHKFQTWRTAENMCLQESDK